MVRKELGAKPDSLALIYGTHVVDQENSHKLSLITTYVTWCKYSTPGVNTCNKKVPSWKASLTELSVRHPLIADMMEIIKQACHLAPISARRASGRSGKTGAVTRGDRSMCVTLLKTLHKGRVCRCLQGH